MQVKVTEYRQIDNSGPLGGISYVYVIHVCYNDPESSEPSEYEINRTFIEFVDMHSKLKKKFPKNDVPSLAKSLQGVQVTCKARLEALTQLLSKISDDDELVNSLVIQNFIDFKQRTKKTPCKDEEIVVTSIENQDKIKPSKDIVKTDHSSLEDFMKEYEDEQEKVTFDIKEPKIFSDEISNTLSPKKLPVEKNSEMPPKDKDLFQASSQNVGTISTKSFEKEKKDNLNTPMFEEIKQERNKKKESFFEEGEDLFLPKEKNVEEEEKIEDLFIEMEKSEKPIRTNQNVADEIFKSKNNETSTQSSKTSINFFEDLDYGDKIFKDEEHLFLIQNENDDSKKEGSNVTELGSETSELMVDDSLNDIMKLLDDKKTKNSLKPQPAPRKGTPVLEGSTKSSETAGRPSVPKKPAISAKPKIGDKPKIVNKPSTTVKPSISPKKPILPNKPSTSVETDNLSHLDIDKYIKQQSDSDNVNLFD